MVTKVHFPTADELAQTMATVIAGVAGGTTGKWRRVIGPVEQLPTWCNIHCNWRVTARGSDAERAVVEQAVAIVRAAHPYI
jgi:alpha-D-ribose 1-methylphosphonate 5-triphosphate synthase subunit PhnH